MVAIGGATGARCGDGAGRLRHGERQDGGCVTDRRFLYNFQQPI